MQAPVHFTTVATRRVQYVVYRSLSGHISDWLQREEREKTGRNEGMEFNQNWSKTSAYY